MIKITVSGQIIIVLYHATCWLDSSYTNWIVIPDLEPTRPAEEDGFAVLRLIFVTFIISK